MPRPLFWLCSRAARISVALACALTLPLPARPVNAQARLLPPPTSSLDDASRVGSPVLGAAWHPLFTRYLTPGTPRLDLPLTVGPNTTARVPMANNTALARVLYGFWSPRCFANSYDPGERDIGAPEPGTRILIPYLGADVNLGRVWYGFADWRRWRPTQLTKMVVNNFPDVVEVLESTEQGWNPGMLRCDGSGCGVRFLFYENKRFDRGFDLSGAYRIWHHRDALTLGGGSDWMHIPIVQFVPGDGNAVSGDEGFYLRKARQDIIVFTHNELVAWVTKRTVWDRVAQDRLHTLFMMGEWRKLAYKSHTYRYADTTRGEITLIGPSFHKNTSRGALLASLPIPNYGAGPPGFIPYYGYAANYPAIEGGVAEGTDHPLLIKMRNIQGGRLLKAACENPTAAGIRMRCDNPPVPLGDTTATRTQIPDSSLLRLTPADTAWGPLVRNPPLPPVWQHRHTVQGAIAADRSSTGAAASLASLQEQQFATYCAGLGYTASACSAAMQADASLAAGYQSQWQATLETTVSQCAAGTLTNATLCDQATTEKKYRDCLANPRSHSDCASVIRNVTPDSTSTLLALSNEGMDLALADTVNMRAPNPPKYRAYTPGVCFSGVFSPTRNIEAEWQKKLKEHDMRLQQPDMVPMASLPKPGTAANRLAPALDPGLIRPEQRAIYEAWWVRNCPGQAIPTTWNLKGMQCDMGALAPAPNVYRAGAGPRPAPPPPTGVPTRPPLLDDD